MTFIVLIIVLGIMILVHEAGHFIPAKIFNVSVPVFSLGFGKRLIGKKIGETDYRLSLFPFGGYVKMKGMDPGEYSGDKREFLSKPVWQRIIIIFAGPFSNFILALLIVYIVTIGFGTVKFPNAPLAETAGSEAGVFQKGDSIISVNDNMIYNFNDVYESIEWNKENRFTVSRDSEIINLSSQIKNPEEFRLIPMIEPVVGKVVENTPAHESGIEQGDKIMYIDSVKVTDWRQISSELNDRYNKETEIIIKRNGNILPLIVVPDKMETMEGDSMTLQGISRHRISQYEGISRPI